MEGKDTLTISMDKELKAILEEEAKNLNYSLSKYIEMILKERNIESIFKKMADSIGINLQ